MTTEKAATDKTVTNKAITNGQTKMAEKTPSSLSKLDVDKILKKAHASYDKNEKGLASLISTGKTISRPREDKDFICLPGENNFFKQVTMLPGLAWGFFGQVSGKSNSGKSSILMCFMKAAQDEGHAVILFDSEKKFSPNRFDTRMGGHSEDLFVINTNSILDGVEGIANLVYAIKDTDPKRKILIVWDSLAGTLSRLEDDEESEKMSQQPGVTAKEISFSIKKLAKLINKFCDKETGENSIAVLMSNQVYMTMPKFGFSVPKEKCGDTVEYFSSLILRLTRKKDLTRVKNGETYRFGIISSIKIVKNHLFEGSECIDNAEIAVSADGVFMAKDIKSFEDVQALDVED